MPSDLAVDPTAIQAFRCDVTNSAALAAAFAAAVRVHGAPNVVINNAGIAEEGHFASAEVSMHLWKREKKEEKRRRER